MIEKAIKILEVIVNFVQNIKAKYTTFRKAREQKRLHKNADAIKKDIADGAIDDLNDRLMK